MDEESYINAAQSAVNQPLGGKEMRFPFCGQSSVVSHGRLGSAYTVGSVNVILRSHWNWGRNGGTRPGLKPVSGTQLSDGGNSAWLWPNGEKILWPDGDTMCFAGIGEKIVMPDGGVLVNQHERFRVGASKGSVPGVMSACAMYRARMVVAGGNMWYASRIGAYDDFDYGGDMADPSRPVAGNLALAGREGEDVTAIAAIADSMMYVSTRRSLWRVSGEVTQSLSQVSETLGIISRDAWCWDGIRFWFVGDEGLYSIAVGEPPVCMTSHLKDVFTGWNEATLVFDAERGGIHIFGNDRSGSAADWFYDISNKAAWKVSYPTAIRPYCGGLAMLDGKNRVVFRCADGMWRYWDENQLNDDGVDIVSVLSVGPVVHTSGNTENAFLAELDFEMDANITSPSGIRISGCVGRTLNEVTDAAKAFVSWAASGGTGTGDNSKFTYAASPGWNKVVRPRVRCNAFAIVVWSTAGRWTLSNITAAHRGCGRIRG